VAPLVGENRALVKEGLRAIHASPLPGLQALLRCAGAEPRSVDSEGVSFVIAPRLNAAGRLEHASTAYALLTASSAEEAAAPAETLEGLNHERQRLTEECHGLAREQVLSWDSLPPLLLVADEGFSPGVTGLVASRLVEEFYRPSVVVALEEVARASARSIGEFNMIAALSRCDDLFLRYGGHPQAAGFIMEPEKLPILREHLLTLAEDILSGIELRPALAIDAHLSFKSLNGEALQWLRALEPYGPGNPPPVFLARNVEVLRSRTMGEDGAHLRLVLREGNVTWEAVAFRQGERAPAEGSRVDVAFTIGADWWHGAEVLSLRVLDFRPSV
jgi:single-stranded-DNA-specific exonuclease